MDILILLQLPSYFKTKLEQSVTPGAGAEIDPSLLGDAALAYDTAKVLLSALSLLIPQRDQGRENFTRSFYRTVLESRTEGYTVSNTFMSDWLSERLIGMAVYSLSGWFVALLVLLVEQ